MVPVTHSTPHKHWRARVVDRVPLALLTHAHEAAIAVTLLIVAFPLISGIQGTASIHEKVDPFIAGAWAWALLAGSFLTLWGLLAFRPRAEWSGQMILGYALTFYAFAIAWGAGVQGLVTSSIFGILGVVSWWRSFKLTSQPYIQYRLNQAALAAYQQAEAERVIREGRARQRERRDRENR